MLTVTLLSRTSRGQMPYPTGMVFTEDVSTVTVEVEQPKIKTVVKCMEDGDFYSHERPVYVPESCDVKITVVMILKEIGGACCFDRQRKRHRLTRSAETRQHFTTKPPATDVKECGKGFGWRVNWTIDNRKTRLEKGTKENSI